MVVAGLAALEESRPTSLKRMAREKRPAFKKVISLRLSIRDRSEGRGMLHSSFTL
jgi:hypothetical protein